MFTNTLERSHVYQLDNLLELLASVRKRFIVLHSCYLPMTLPLRISSKKVAILRIRWLEWVRTDGPWNGPICLVNSLAHAHDVGFMSAAILCLWKAHNA